MKQEVGAPAFGNAVDAARNTRGWFLGHFAPGADNPLRSDDVEPNTSPWVSGTRAAACFGPISSELFLQDDPMDDRSAAWTIDPFARTPESEASGLRLHASRLGEVFAVRATRAHELCRDCRGATALTEFRSARVD
jgi:hypothetical protein